MSCSLAIRPNTDTKLGASSLTGWQKRHPPKACTHTTPRAAARACPRFRPLPVPRLLAHGRGPRRLGAQAQHLTVPFATGHAPWAPWAPGPLDSGGGYQAQCTTSSKSTHQSPITLSFHSHPFRHHHRPAPSPAVGHPIWPRLCSAGREVGGSNGTRRRMGGREEAARAGPAVHWLAAAPRAVTVAKGLVVATSGW